MKAYTVIARAIGARNRITQTNEWYDRWQARIDQVVRTFPKGSGFDRGTKLDDNSTPERLIFHVDYHHMNDGGYYDGWSEHQVIVTPSLEFQYKMRITGPDRNDIRDHISESFNAALQQDITDEPIP